MAVPRYNGSPPPLIWHTVMQILGSTRISGDRSFSRSLPSPPDYAAIGPARPGIDYSRIIVISHISCSQWCKTHHRLGFIVDVRVSVCVQDILMDSQRQMENSFHATGLDIVCNLLCSLFANDDLLMLKSSTSSQPFLSSPADLLLNQKARLTFR